MNEQYTRAPHRSTSSGSSPSPNAALLIDFDNVTMAMRSNLGQELRNFLNSDIVRGKVSVQRAYADWRRYPQYIVPLSEASIDLIFAPAYGSSKKNATDIRLAIDALELVFTRPEIGTYLLLSGDSDFSSLVLKLKEYGKYVIGVGLQESSSDLLVQNCDEYYSYNSLSGLTSADELTTQSHDPWELVERAVHRMNDRDDVMRSDRLKQVMLEMDGGFDEKDHGFSKFNRFLAEASSRGLVKLRKIGDGQYEVKPAREREDADRGDGEARKTDRKTGGKAARPKERSSGRGSSDRKRERDGRDEGRPPGKRAAPSKTSAPVDTSTLKAGYDLLRDVVEALADEDEPVRDSEVKREMLRRDENFDEAALGFSKFSRFLRQAHDEEVVDVAKDEDGNYHLAPAGSGVAERAAAGAGEGEERAGPERPTPAPESGGETNGAAAGAGREEPESEEPGPEERSEPEAGAASAEAGGPTTDEGRSGGRRRRRGLGRGRRGSGGASTEGSRAASDDEDAPTPGPVDEAGGEGDRDAKTTAAGEESAPTGGDASSDGGRGRGRRRGGLGRFRKGSRGRGSAPETAPSGGPGGSDDGGGGGESPAGEEQKAEPSGEAAVSPDEESRGRASGSAEAGSGGDGGGPIPEEAEDDPVGHMVGRWPGVGRKTAEKLVEAFGAEVFDVIDRSPERLTEVLPDHRAQAVVQARREERERVQA